MEINPLGASTATTNPLAGGLNSNQVKDLSSQFMTLLVTQLQNQNPLEPREGAEFLSDIVNMTSLEELTKIRESIGRLEEVDAPAESLNSDTLEGFPLESAESAPTEAEESSAADALASLNIGNVQNIVKDLLA